MRPAGTFSVPLNPPPMMTMVGGPAGLVEDVGTVYAIRRSP
jgi:hypothetical protein